VGTEFWMSLGDATDGIADAGRDGFAGTFGGSVGERPRAAVGSRGAAQLSQELFALIGSALLAGEVGVSLGGAELVVQLSQPSPVCKECGAIDDGIGWPSVRAVGDLAAGEAEGREISSRVGE
jgi:hypothetical protein